MPSPHEEFNSSSDKAGSHQCVSGTGCIEDLLGVSIDSEDARREPYPGGLTIGVGYGFE